VDRPASQRARVTPNQEQTVNLKTPDTQAQQSNAIRQLTEKELDAIVGGLRITVTNKKGEKVVIDL
jgi:bacteriocin-like protein